MLRHPRFGFSRSSLFAFISLLTGCIDSQGIVPQATRLDDGRLAVGDAIAAADAQADWPRARWWQAFGDAQLNDWVERALQGSPSMAIALARVRQARALAGAVEADEQPQLGLDVSLQRKRWPDDGFYGPGDLARSSTWNNTEQLGLRYPLDLWGRERSRGEAAMDAAHARVAEARAAALELQGNMVRSYIALALHYAERDVAQANLARQEHQAELARQRRRDGIGTGLEVSQAQVGLPEARRVLDALDESIALAQNQIAALAGEGPGAARLLRRPQLNTLGEIDLPSRLPLELLGRRPDVVACRWQVAAQARDVEAAKADFYPNIDLVAGIGSSATQGSALDFLRYDRLTYGIGPALSLPVFDGGRRRGQLGVAAGAYDEAVERYNQTLVQALKAVSDSLIRLHSLHEQQTLVGESLAVAQRNVDLAETAQRRGLTDYRDVLDAQPLLFQRQRQQQRLRAQYLEAQADLLVALGGGMLPEGAGPKEPALSPRPIVLRGLAP